MDEMGKVKIGILGCGKQAVKHIEGFRKTPGVEMVLADLQPDLAEKMAGQQGLDWRADPEAVFADPNVKAVDICTPTFSHVPLIRRAIVSGKDFFCEKPLGATLEEVRLVKEETATNGRIGMVGYVYRFAPAFELGRKLFEDVPTTGESTVLGRITTAFFRIGGRGSHQVWKHRRESGGGAVNEMLVHMLDLAIWYLGPVEEVRVLSEKLLRPSRLINGEEVKADAEDYILVRIRTRNGITAFIQADLVTPAFTQYAEIQGENGTFMASIQPDMPCYVHCDRERAGYAAGKTPFQFGKRNLFEAQMSEFVRAVRTGSKPERNTVEDSVLLMEAMEKLNAERKV